MAHKYSLPAELTIYAVGPTRSLFGRWVSKLPKGRRGAVAAGGALAVDSSAVAEVDAAGVQLLLSLSRTLAGRKRSLALVNPSTALSSACQALGVSRLLGGDAVEGAAR